jgi:hypothetical protein
MCVCRPEVRTPWCGGPGCKAPKKEKEGIREGDGDVTAYETPSKPRLEYPHTNFIEQLAKDALERVLSEEEAMAVTEATMFENLIEDTIPELRDQIGRLHCIAGCCACGPACQCKDHPTLAVKNANVFLGVACRFAQGMAADVRRVMERRSLLTHIAGLKP